MYQGTELLYYRKIRFFQESNDNIILPYPRFAPCRIRQSLVHIHEVMLQIYENLRENGEKGSIPPIREEQRVLPGHTRLTTL